MRFYMINSTSGNPFPDNQTGSLSLPNGDDATNGSRGLGGLTTTDPTFLGNFVGQIQFTLPQTTRQSGLVHTFSSPRLAPQVIPAQNWTVAASIAENNTNANAFLALFIGIYRPPRTGTSDIWAGRIYDSSVELSTEFSTSAAVRTATVSGSEVYVQAGDSLVLELWWTGIHAKAATYEIQLGIDQGVNYFDSTNDIIFYNEALLGPFRSQRTIVTS